MMDKFIPLSVPNLKGNELKYVTEAVESEWVSTAGKYVTTFENEISKYVGSTGAVACQSGTAGLHISLLLSGVTNQDAVIVPTLTFIAAVNPVKYIGAEPIFMDCDDSLCMDPDKLRSFCEEKCIFNNNILMLKSNGKRIKAIIVVHVFGNMADMEAILSIAEKYNLKVIEDATEALGTYYTEGKYKGCFAGTMGDFGVYSFNGNKIITTGGGGMILTKEDETLQHARHLTTQAKSDELYFEHDEIGFNYRMTNLQAALGLAQIEQLEAFITTKIDNYDLYKSKLSHIDGLKLMDFRKCTRSNHWFYALLCDGYEFERDNMIKKLSEHGIQTRPIWGLIHEQKPYLDGYSYCIEKAIYYRQNIVNIPCSTNLLPEDVETVVNIIEQVK